jgi:hypothetical protein
MHNPPPRIDAQFRIEAALCQRIEEIAAGLGVVILAEEAVLIDCDWFCIAVLEQHVDALVTPFVLARSQRLPGTPPCAALSWIPLSHAGSIDLCGQIGFVLR